MSSTKFSQQGVTRARARFITQAISLEEHAAPGTVRSGVVFTTMLIAGFLLWSWSTEIAEAARAPGKVVPAGLVQKIQHLEGGLVGNIHVRNGDRVEAGDPLLNLATESNRSELAQLGSRRADIALNLERVSALLNDREPRFDTFESFSDLHAGQRQQYHHQRAAQREQLALVDAQVAQRESEIASVNNQIEAIKSELSLIRELAEMQKAMAKTAILSKAEVINTQVRLLATQRDYRELEGRSQGAASAKAEAEQRRAEMISRWRETLSTEAGALTAELEETTESLRRIEQRLARLTIRSPVTGIVKGLAVNTLNEVVQPGQVLMEVVPVDRALMVEARISTVDVGHIKTGQAVDVKVSSYESTRFGTVKGKLKRISASTYLDEGGQPYYLAEVALSRDYLGDDPERNRIIPGMTVQADVLTGSRTVMDYMLKPVYRGFQTSFRER